MTNLAKDINVFTATHLPFHASKHEENPMIKTFFFPTVLFSPASLQGVLCVTSAQIDALNGRNTSNPHTLTYRSEATRLLREGFESPDHGISDDAIGAIIVLSTHEVR